jgi:hypothetical protein
MFLRKKQEKFTDKIDIKNPVWVYVPSSQMVDVNDSHKCLLPFQLLNLTLILRKYSDSTICLINRHNYSKYVSECINLSTLPEDIVETIMKYKLLFTYGGVWMSIDTLIIQKPDKSNKGMSIYGNDGGLPEDKLVVAEKNNILLKEINYHLEKSTRKGFTSYKTDVARKLILKKCRNVEWRMSETSISQPINKLLSREESIDNKLPFLTVFQNRDQLSYNYAWFLKLDYHTLVSGSFLISKYYRRAFGIDKITVDIVPHEKIQQLWEKNFL